MKFGTVCVVGAGTMGNGIAHVLAQYGHTVRLVDVRQDLLDAGIRTIAANLDRQVKKGTLTGEQKAATLSRISAATDLGAAGAASDIAIEAATEHAQTKKEIFRRLDAACRPGV
ncbi:MAG TPA: 3-hydroxyacyl-CoA dehydrogenase NAD-binding domain-containing protein, partial [Bacteroidota bacterium]|nr:3-hydroxyacyl-CoA dehydrogenase NAD-binding domain-containing protein [Bacteroidota bacterium]